MLHKAIRQFLEDVDWGELDYLLIDLPPGTGDVSMTLAQLLPQAKFVIVTTPAISRSKRLAVSAARLATFWAAGCSPTSSTFRCSARSRSRRSCG